MTPGAKRFLKKEVREQTRLLRTKLFLSLTQNKIWRESYNGVLIPQLLEQIRVLKMETKPVT